MNGEPPSHRLKLLRAVDHLYALNAAEQRWFEDDACKIVDESEPETRKHVVRIRILKPPADPLMPLLIGETVHSMRQALDHIAYKLAVMVAGTSPPPNEGTAQFPILSDPSGRRKFKDRLVSYIGAPEMMPPGLYTTLEGLQPYHGGDRELLGALSSMDNLDKHRFPPIVTGAASVGPVDVLGDADLSAAYTPRTGAIKDGTPIFEYTPRTDSEVNVRTHFTGAIAFDEASPVAAGQLVVEFLSRIRLFIRDEVFPPLEGLLVKHGDGG